MCFYGRSNTRLIYWPTCLTIPFYRPATELLTTVDDSRTFETDKTGDDERENITAFLINEEWIRTVAFDVPN